MSAPPLPGQPRLLDRVRHAIRARHYSLRTEEAYVAWIRRYIVFHKKRHPMEMGETEINAFARPPGPARVRHHRAEVPIIAASSRQVAASAGPCPATSPGLSVRPAYADSGMVR